MNKTSGLRYGNYYIYGYFDNDFYDSGKDGCAELNEFLDKFQTTPPLISKNYVAIFYNGYGRMHARLYKGPVV